MGFYGVIEYPGGLSQEEYCGQEGVNCNYALNNAIWVILVLIAIFCCCGGYFRPEVRAERAERRAERAARAERQNAQRAAWQALGHNHEAESRAERRNAQRAAWQAAVEPDPWDVALGHNHEQNNERTPAEEQAPTRSDTVKSALEFRKILASSSPRRTAVLGPPLEDDLELGEGRGNKVDNINPSSLELLLEMGFTTNASKKALQAVGGLDTEAAMDWIFDHQNDPDLNDDDPEDSMISADTNRLDSASVRSFMTSSMHFLTKVGLAGRNNSQNKECCSICLEEYKVGDTVARLKRTPEQVERERRGLLLREDDCNGECNHWFHNHCITEWLQNNDECPLCRVNLVHQQP